MSSKKLSGRVAVVTGASKGIGAGIAKLFGEEGASVLVNYSSDKAGAEKTVGEITKAGGKAVAFKADMSKPEEIKALFAEAKKEFGAIDVLVNNAGIFQFQPLGEITPESFHKHFNINVLGLILATQESLPHFKPEGGSIINISSIVSTFAPPGSAVYNATKGAVDTLTRTFAKELGSKKIRVNAINPGLVKTEGSQAIEGIDQMTEQMLPMIPVGRIGTPEDIAHAAVYLAAPGSEWVTGQMFYISGGMS